MESRSLKGYTYSGAIGVFFLVLSGQLHFLLSEPSLAITAYNQAIDVQQQYRNLHYISWWELAICHLSLWDIKSSLEFWSKLQQEATWSKACYDYGMAVCLLHEEQYASKDEKDNGKDRARKLMDEIPRVTNRIAGKSIPVEVSDSLCMFRGISIAPQKFVARKARKFFSQKQRLMLPIVELAYVFQAITHSPRDIIVDKMLPEVDHAFEQLQVDPSRYPGGAKVFWDDWALAKFLEGICARYMAYPVSSRSSSVGIAS
jgi:hypothetical protein